MRKSATDPRRIYSRSHINFVLYCGKQYSPGDETNVDANLLVTCEALPREGGKLRILVTQKRGKGRRTLTETWTQVNMLDVINDE